MVNPYAKCVWLVDAIDEEVLLFEIEQFACKEVEHDAPSSVVCKSEWSLIRWSELYGVACVNEKKNSPKFSSL